MKEIDVNTKRRVELVDVTSKVKDFIQKEKISDGIIILHVPHTTAAITINENADPDVVDDIIRALEIFDRDDYRHAEGNSSAHVKSSLIGCSLCLNVKDGSIVLGTWQGIMFCEFDGPRNRKLYIDTINNIK